MKIKPLKTDTDYKSALQHVQRLWNAEPDTANGDDLDVLITRIEVYEAMHHPIDPPDPIDAIKFRMDQKGLRRIDLAPIL